MKGQLKIILLKALQENSGSSGAELARIIENKIGKEPSPGSLYPLLKSLDQKGAIEASKSGKENIYQLTHKGQEAIEGLQDQQKEIMDKVIRSLKTYEFLFEEEEIEDLIEYMERGKSCLEEIPNYFIKLEQLKELIMNNEEKLNEDEVNQALAETREKIENMF